MLNGGRSLVVVSNNFLSWCNIFLSQTLFDLVLNTVKLKFIYKIIFICPYFICTPVHQNKMLHSGVVYHLLCPCCSARYVGLTNRHLQTRYKDHHQKPGRMKIHLEGCKTSIPEENVEII